jgi:hypothetical protein
MWPVMQDVNISGLRADALFASGLQRCDEPSADQVRQAVATAVREFGCSGCVARVAQEYGDHPEAAVIRMRWARAVTGAAFAGAALRPGPGAVAEAEQAADEDLADAILFDGVKAFHAIQPIDTAC